MRHVFAPWVAEMVGQRRSIVVAMDWTDFDADDQATLALSLVTNHGRATPLLWLTVLKDELKDQRNDFEDLCLASLAQVLPEGVVVTILADRGFGDQAVRLSRHTGLLVIPKCALRMNMAEDIIPPEVHARLLRHFAALSFGFWTGPTRRKATLFALGLFACLLLNLAPAIAVNRWNKFFFDALQNKDERLILLSIGLMLALAELCGKVGDDDVRKAA